MNQSTQESSPEVTKPTFQRVAENPYRREPSGGYYAVLKRDGKQIWKFLKAPDRKLAERRLAEFAGLATNLHPKITPMSPFLSWLPVGSIPAGIPSKQASQSGRSSVSRALNPALGA